MLLNLSGRHVEITPALRAYVEDKFARLERHFDHVIGAHVVLGVEKQRHVAEATVQLNAGSLFADARNKDMYAAIDGLVDRLDRQIRKHKEKLSGRKRRRAAPRAR